MMVEQMAPHWRRRTALALMALAVAVIITSLLAFRRDMDDARAAAARLRSESVEVEDDIADLNARRAALSSAQAVANRRHRQAVDRLEALRQSEAEELERLRAATEEREAAEAQLGSLKASVAEASEETERNEALIQALDRCLDGATRAANALSVGDVGRALANVTDVRRSCEQVDVVIGP